MRKCIKCGEYKPLSMFYKSSTCNDKMHPYCKDCMKRYIIERGNKRSEVVNFLKELREKNEINN